MELAAKVIAYDTGSLPDGGREANTPIWSVAKRLVDPEASVEPQLTDLSWGAYQAFIIDNVLTADECARMIAMTEQLGFRDAAPGISTPPGMRQNTTVHWLAEAQDVALIHQRIAHLLPESIEGCERQQRLSHRFNTYRYTRNQRFRPHLDGDWPGYGLDQTGEHIETWPDGLSMLSMLLYLNGAEEGIEGGDTLLFDGQSIRHRVTPKTGRALFFRHGIHERSVLHAGDQLTGDVPKYVVRINVIYETRPLLQII